MKRILNFLVILSLIISACQTTKETTKYITKPLTTPPEPYRINQMNSAQDLVYEYRRAIMKISEWQVWYDIQVGTNYFRGGTTNTNSVQNTNSMQITNK